MNVVFESKLTLLGFLEYIFRILVTVRPELRNSVDLKSTRSVNLCLLTVNNKQIKWYHEHQGEIREEKERFLGDKVKKKEQKTIKVCRTFEPNYGNV